MQSSVLRDVYLRCACRARSTAASPPGSPPPDLLAGMEGEAKGVTAAASGKRHGDWDAAVEGSDAAATTQGAARRAPGEGMPVSADRVGREASCSDGHGVGDADDVPAGAAVAELAVYRHARASDGPRRARCAG